MDRSRNLDQLTWMDYGLSLLAGSLAVYSLGMGLSNPQLGYFLIGVLAVGTISSYFIHRLVPSQWAWTGGLLYAAIAFAAFSNASRLNAFLPGDGIPFALMMSGALAWMMALGSFATWRDTTLIFQSVPTIALFGLVGTFGTFREAPFAFFGFLLCFTMLFARAHGRLMMRQADEAGFSEEPLSPESYWERLKVGPWRWMAGPEWALGSALAIIMLSVLGAPVLQATVQPLAGQLRSSVPRPTPQRPESQPLQNDPLRGDQPQVTNVGQGPRMLRHRRVFQTNLPAPTYLRMNTYAEYTGRGWSTIREYTNRTAYARAAQDPDSELNLNRNSVLNYRRFVFQIWFDGPAFQSLPIPGEIHDLPSPEYGVARPDGTLRISGDFREPSLAIRMPSDNAGTFDTAGAGQPSILSEPPVRTTERVRQLALEVTRGALNDREKADAIKQAIEQRVVYDLQSPGVPPGQDVVDYFLFESRRGYCDLFASAMVTMARTVGLPARYVTGFYPARNIKNDVGMVLHESEGHAWAEIFFDGAGWVAFDPTEGAPNVGDATVSENWWEQGWVRTAGFVLAGFAALFVPVFGVRYIRGRSVVIDPERQKLSKAYGAFVRELESKSGRPKRPSQTPNEYLEAVQPSLGDFYTAAWAINAKFVNEFYRRGKPNGQALLDEVKQFRHELRRRR